MGSFKYINDIVTRENLTQFLEFVDLAAGAGRRRVQLVHPAHAGGRGGLTREVTWHPRVG